MLDSLNKSKADRIIWGIFILLALCSLVTVYSSTGTLAYKNQNGNSLFYLFKHGLFVFLALWGAYYLHTKPINYLKKISKIGIFASGALLLYTLLNGSNINEAHRWISIAGVTVQSSDIAKVFLIIFISSTLANGVNSKDQYKEVFIPILIATVCIGGLIVKDNFSTGFLVFALSIIMMFVGGIRFKYIATLIGVCVVGFTLYVLVAKFSGNGGRIGTWINRIENFGQNDKDANFQTIQGKIAIARGGVLGLGPGNSKQRNFLPHPYSDFIYAIICEEYGLWGATLILGCYIVLFLRVIRIMNKCEKAFGAFLAFGCTLVMVMQAMVNMIVATGIGPVTGQPLPMVSMGGTSVLVNGFYFAIILGISHSIAATKGESQEGSYAS